MSHDHLSSLGADFVPVLEAALLLELREMLLHLVVAWVRAVAPVVSACQGHEVIPDLASVFDTPDEHPVVPGSVETIFECSPQLRQTALAKADRRVVGSHEQASGSMHPHVYRLLWLARVMPWLQPNRFVLSDDPSEKG